MDPFCNKYVSSCNHSFIHLFSASHEMFLLYEVEVDQRLRNAITNNVDSIINSIKTGKKSNPLMTKRTSLITDELQETIRQGDCLRVWDWCWGHCCMTQISWGKGWALTKTRGTTGPEGFGQSSAFPEADLCHTTVTESPVSNPIIICFNT